MTGKGFFLDVVFPCHISTYKIINSAELGLVGIDLWVAICTDQHDPIPFSEDSKSARWAETLLHSHHISWFKKHLEHSGQPDL